MSRRPAPSAGSAVSLFPFLAVLLCTIGSLVLLLVVIARQARTDAERETARRASAATTDFTEIDRQREDLSWQVEQLSASHRKTSDILVEQRSHLSHLEEHAQRLRDEIKQWEEAQRQLAERTSLDAAAQEKLRAELAEMKRRAEETEAKLTEVKGRVKKTAFAVVPYDGQNGTRRRPIYIECRGDSIVIQPEGIVFTENDFSGSLGPSNPLAACVRATAEHHARTGSLQPGEQPYPLLLVRPDGVMAYYVARAAMTSWDSEFGYELVDAEWSLDFPKFDPQLQQLLVNVQTEARRRQEMIAREAPSLRQTDRPSFRSSSAGEGSGDVDQGMIAQGGGAAAPGGAGGSGNGNGNGAIDAPYVPPQGYIAESGGVGLPSGTSIGGNGGGGYGAGGTGSPGSLGGGMGGIPGAAGTGGGPQLIAPGATPGNGFAAAGGSGMAGAPGQIAGQTGTAGGGPYAGNGSGTGGPGTAGEAGDGTGSPGGSTSNGGNAASGTGSNRSGSPGMTADPNANPYSSSSNPDSLIASADPSRSGAGSAGLSGGSGSGGSNSPSGGGSSSGGSGAAGGSSGSGGSSGGGSSGGGSSASGGGSSTGSGGAKGGVSPSVSMVHDTRSSDGGVDSLAKKRGKDWSLPDAARKSTPVSRPVQIYCSADRVTVFSDRNIPDRQINFGPRTADAVDELVKSVWSQVDAWGMAGRGMYWRPTMSIHYAPDGAKRFSELRTLLVGSGLEVTGKPIHVAAPLDTSYDRR